jgi:hypothetical protein
MRAQSTGVSRRKCSGSTRSLNPRSGGFWTIALVIEFVVDLDRVDDKEYSCWVSWADPGSLWTCRETSKRLWNFERVPLAGVLRVESSLRELPHLQQ